jgi:hypothetical protein
MLIVFCWEAGECFTGRPSPTIATSTTTTTTTTNRQYAWKISTVPSPPALLPSRLSTRLKESRSTTEEEDPQDQSLDNDEEGNAYKESSNHHSRRRSGSFIPNVIKSTVGKAASSVKDLAQAGGSSVASVVGTAASGVVGFAQRGSSDVRTVASATASGVVGFAQRGSSDVRTVASAATSGLQGLVQRGASDVVSMAGGVRNLAETSATSASEMVQWMDAQAKGGVTVVNSNARQLVLGFTGKTDYQVGDVTKELLRRIVSSDYNLSDMILLLKVVLTIGATFGPLAKAIPITVLLEMLNVSLEKEIGGKIIETIAMSLDDRFTAAIVFTGDDKYQLGDLTKRSITGAILKFTGKDSYQSGDIERAVVVQQNSGDKGTKQTTSPTVTERLTTEEQTAGSDNTSRATVIVAATASAASTTTTSTTATGNSDVTPSRTVRHVTPKRLELLGVGPEFEEWDRLFRQSYPDIEAAAIASLAVETTPSTEKWSGQSRNPAVVVGDNSNNSNNINPILLDKKIAMELEEWDKMFMEKYPDTGL